VLEILRDHRGPGRAITAERIGEMVFGRAEAGREVREIITELIVQDGHGEIIANTGGSAVRGYGPGYFWAVEWRQVEAYYDVLVSRRHDIEHRMTAAWQARQRLLRAPVEQEAML
jgi:hypothetical protein